MRLLGFIERRWKMADILILGVAIVVAALFAVFSAIPFMKLPESNGLDVHYRR